ncbi:hypothetical protein SCOR_02520 [Sulfidibacter corallicola]|uniref:Uncharacterized protein n=1 Tax=Sulfidibacter corallicola TaxID=2818388 RepID=A0A8A4TER7_SULCO|nr:hypothetical protein [Sulfidibacter corallicola]QTD48599.1 hypothetical protein J3U87_23715 [Sulfidibacter corallicola]
MQVAQSGCHNQMLASDVVTWNITWESGGTGRSGYSGIEDGDGGKEDPRRSQRDVKGKPMLRGPASGMR